MKVDRNMKVNEAGVPLRLEIASRLVAANIASGIYEVRNRLGMPGGCAEISEAMLDFADTLIDAHNASCGEVAGE